MKIVNSSISLAELKQMAQSKFGDLVKAVVDIERGIMAVDAELHADEEALLIENGSNQEYLWGINLYPGLKKDEWIEFDSMINLKPRQGTLSRGVGDGGLRGKIVDLVDKLVNS